MANLIESNYFQILLKTVMAVILGGVIGMERQNKHRPAGFRTHILVCLGSMTVMAISELMFFEYYEKYGIASDPARMAAQVISGIGFLGAGTIIHHGVNVKGLTTAASLWATAAVGLAVGAGFYYLAIVVAASIYLILMIFNNISHNMNEKAGAVEFVIQLLNKPKTIGGVNLVFAKRNINVLNLEYSETNDGDMADDKGASIITMNVVAKFGAGDEVFAVVSEIQEIAGVISVERI